ncbi:uncharacterized protein BDW43DRAFT_312140 [Aspergillus alliaceus]|uniref:uncharacterized protein n=1 Tax=Petromyces alliaceus TaxID=209559 RepID=UPI0012A530FA|nr:uncharacterized protein BDW43DRAFT_312140 [Aspergillus alliaceus]KAB8232466.1 hypothetical protein BDW43DRAFT_312140 [Aspergillus alliaceus]
MKLTSVVIPLFLSLSVNAMPIANAEDTAATLEARSVKCRFKSYGWQNVKCFYQGADWGHSWLEVGPNTSINAEDLDMATCNIKDIPGCPS